LMPPWRFIIDRVVNRFITLLVLTIFSFFVFEVIPQAIGMKVAYIFAGVAPGSTRSAGSASALIAAATRTYDLNGPIPARLLKFIVNMFTGNYGVSVFFQKPVLQVVLQYLPNTLILATSSLALTSVLSIITGVVAAKSFLRSRRKLGDKSVSIASIGLYFVPALWISIIFYIYFADQLGLFPINLAQALTGLGSHNYTGIMYYLRYAWAAVLPVAVLTITGFGHRQQLLRNNIIEEYTSSSHVEYARARGLDDRTIFYKHAFRNAILPWITVVGLDVAFLIYGIFFVEYVFQFQGIGYASTLAAQNLDMPFLIATTFMFGVYTLIVLFILDFVLAKLDPRIRLGE